MTNRLTFTWMLLLSAVLTAQEAEPIPLNPRLLGQIQQSLGDPTADGQQDPSFSQSWRYGNMLSAVFKPYTASDNTSIYWSGASKFRQKNPDSVTMTQVIFDILLAHPTKLYTPSTHTDKLIDKIFLAVTGSEIDDTAREFIRTALQTYTTENTPERRFYQYYHSLSKLQIQAQSCGAFWETSNQMGRKVPPVFVLNKTTRKIPDNILTCQKAICTTRINEPFNAFYDISSEVGTIRENLNSLNCQLLFPNDSAQRSICQKAQSSAGFDRAREGQAVMKIKDGKVYINKLPKKIEGTLSIIKSLVVMHISQAVESTIASNSEYQKYKSIGFMSLVEPNRQVPKSCSNTSKGEKLASCDFAEDKSSTKISRAINLLFGLNSDFNAIYPGLSTGLDDDDNFVSLVAGQFVDFQPYVITTGTDLKNWQSKQTINDKKLFLTNATKEDILTFRVSQVHKFHQLRNKQRVEQIQRLISKSASASIAQSIKKQNHSELRYKTNKGQVEVKQSHQTLKESSNWRLSDKEANWLANISAMTSNALLREIIILLAEIKQLQFFIFHNELQSTLLSLFASVAPEPSIDAMSDLMDEQVYRFIAGLPKSDPQGGQYAEASIMNMQGSDPFEGLGS